MGIPVRADEESTQLRRRKLQKRAGSVVYSCAHDTDSSACDKPHRWAKGVIVASYKGAALDHCLLYSRLPSCVKSGWSLVTARCL